MNEPQTKPLEQRTRLATSTPQAKADFDRLLEKEHKSVKYIPFGEEDEITLTVPLVQQLLCEKTKSGKTCSENDAKKFIVMCRAQRLNPFAGDAFITGYDTKQHDGTWAAKFSKITAHLAYLKRAEASPHYDGMDSGVILMTENGLERRECDFALPDENVVGGWAVVYRKDRSKPIRRECTVANKKPSYESKFWSPEKTPEMIVKCAEMDALKSAFPTLVGGLVSGDLDVTDRFVQPNANGRAGSSLVENVAPPTKAELEPPQAPEDDSNPVPEKPKVVEGSAKSELEKLVMDSGFTFGHFQAFAVAEQLVKDADSLGSFDEVSEADAKRLLRAKTGLLNGMKQIKEQEGK